MKKQVEIKIDRILFFFKGESERKIEKKRRGGFYYDDLTIDVKQVSGLYQRTNYKKIRSRILS